MVHDYGEHYGEQMSLLLDGRLTAQERAALEAHLATCKECRARWAAFQQVDHVLTSVAQVAPAPGFAARFAGKLARQQARRAAAPRRVFAGIGVFATGAAAIALFVVSVLWAVWEGVGALAQGAPSLLINLIAGAPSQLGYLISLVARWLVTLHALNEAGQSVIGALSPSAGPILASYTLILVVVVLAWTALVRGVSGRWNTTTLPVLVWL